VSAMELHNRTRTMKGPTSRDVLALFPWYTATKTTGMFELTTIPTGERLFNHFCHKTNKYPTPMRLDAPLCTPFLKHFPPAVHRLTGDAVAVHLRQLVPADPVALQGDLNLAHALVLVVNGGLYGFNVLLWVWVVVHRPAESKIPEAAIRNTTTNVRFSNLYTL
jgi:hypothetical protein